MESAIGTTLFNAFLIIFALLAIIGVFFFVATRGTLLIRSLFSDTEGSVDHVYPVYSQWWLIKSVDFQPIISAILLFQYGKLVDRIVSEIERTVLSGKRVIITSCAFGNVIPRVVGASEKGGAKSVVIADIIQNELRHAKEKLRHIDTQIDYVQEDALCLKEESKAFEMNVLFFLLHELPNHLKEVALSEAGRVLSPGGKLVLAEFHRPDLFVLRALSCAYFYVFEPYGLSLWSTHDPISYLESSGKWTCKRETFFFGNFQIIVATKN